MILEGVHPGAGTARRAPGAPPEGSLRDVAAAPHADPGIEVETLVDRFLAQQRDLTAVGRFSQRHSDATRPLLEAHYRDLLPLSAPRPGEQYAFEVDLDRCSACKACVSACHSLNGLDDNETWREVGFLTGNTVERRATADDADGADGKRSSSGGVGRSGSASGARFRPSAGGVPAQRIIPLTLVVTTACHHCADPGCMNGCPVLAYDKDPVTGIVRHLDDQCIGCSYCILKCPYEVPKYSEQRGIVRKCDMCHGRLAVGEAPACVQACPSEAIRITVVDRAQPPQWTLPDSPDPSLTRPTTVYRTKRPMEELGSASRGWVSPSAPHWPLAWMLALTQWGGGMVAGAILTALAGPDARSGGMTILVTVAGAFLVGVGMVASAFHLGRPGKAWRVWLGWRRSWLSREALVLGPMAGAMILWAGCVVAESRGWAVMPAGWRWMGAAAVMPILALAVGAQAMVYIDTGRRFWRPAETLPRFVGTVLLGAASAAVLTSPGWVAALAVAAVCSVQLLNERRVLEHGHGGPVHALDRTAWLLRRPLASRLQMRVGLAMLGALMALGTAVGESRMAGPLVCLLLLASACIERHLFFVAMAPDRMPGAPGKG